MSGGADAAVFRWVAADPDCARLWHHAAEFLLARSEEPPAPPFAKGLATAWSVMASATKLTQTKYSKG